MRGRLWQDDLGINPRNAWSWKNEGGKHDIAHRYGQHEVVGLSPKDVQLVIRFTFSSRQHIFLVHPFCMMLTMAYRNQTTPHSVTRFVYGIETRH